MANEIDIQWKVTALDCYSQLNNEKDYVFNVHWDCLSYYSGISGGPYYGRTYSVTSVPQNSGVFIPYSGLTEEITLNWVWEVMGTGKINVENQAKFQIYDQISPKIVTPPLPWASNIP